MKAFLTTALVAVVAAALTPEGARADEVAVRRLEQHMTGADALVTPRKLVEDEDEWTTYTKAPEYSEDVIDNSVTDQEVDDEITAQFSDLETAPNSVSADFPENAFYLESDEEANLESKTMSELEGEEAVTDEIGEPALMTRSYEDEEESEPVSTEEEELESYRMDAPEDDEEESTPVSTEEEELESYRMAAPVDDAEEDSESTPVSTEEEELESYRMDAPEDDRRLHESEPVSTEEEELESYRMDAPEDDEEESTPVSTEEEELESYRMDAPEDDAEADSEAAPAEMSYAEAQEVAKYSSVAEMNENVDTEEDLESYRMEAPADDDEVEAEEAPEDDRRRRLRSV
ncbi:hypothetical protein Poli38472_006782 [Pythium oligandrum]|uniref:Uncharacterized protein n=1 Tax=Pythium oligandrum TaxID=41045 RepID=A0A8K1C660_PYTOL|nr:hypothetical protein Poli38472_006782 [Pythium oligandrum]|eukprot:TMW56772.1 hypothetical protein Poli38472_006782 [Pythium oligandrum]